MLQKIIFKTIENLYKYLQDMDIFKGETLTQIHYKILNISSDGEKHFLVYVCNKTLVQ